MTTTGTSTPAVRPMNPADFPDAAADLAAAFRDDPYHLYLFPDERRRARRFEQSFRVYLRTWAGRSTMLVAPGAGAAVWAPPGHWSAPATTAARELAALLRVYGARRLVPNSRSWLSVEERHPREPHWYLYLLGVRPEMQGRGLGAALVRPMLDRCDRERMPAYLETAKERNVGFYRRLGFEVTEELDPAAGAPHVWLMWREPR